MRRLGRSVPIEKITGLSGSGFMAGAITLGTRWLGCCKRWVRPIGSGGRIAVCIWSCEEVLWTLLSTLTLVFSIPISEPGRSLSKYLNMSKTT